MTTNYETYAKDLLFRQIETIKDFMDRNNISQTELADTIGVSNWSINRVLSHKSVPSSVMLFMLLKALDDLCVNRGIDLPSGGEVKLQTLNLKP